MKKTSITESQIVQALKENESGRKTEEICRELEVSRATFYRWKSQYGGMEASDVKRLKELEEENARLKKMYADLSLDHSILKEVMEFPRKSRRCEKSNYIYFIHQTTIRCLPKKRIHGSSKKRR
jgi:putative transposase